MDRFTYGYETTDTKSERLIYAGYPGEVRRVGWARLIGGRWQTFTEADVCIGEYGALADAAQALYKAAV